MFSCGDFRLKLARCFCGMFMVIGRVLADFGLFLVVGHLRVVLNMGYFVFGLLDRVLAEWVI